MKVNDNTIKLFVRFLKEKNLYETISKRMEKSLNVMKNIDNVISLPSLYYIINNKPHTYDDDLIPQWEEFYLHHIHRKTKVEILEYAMGSANFITLLNDMKIQHNKTINDVLQKYTIQRCIDKALCWANTSNGSAHYMKMYRNVNDYVKCIYKDLYGN